MKLESAMSREAPFTARRSITAATARRADDVARATRRRIRSWIVTTLRAGIRTTGASQCGKSTTSARRRRAVIRAHSACATAEYRPPRIGTISTAAPGAPAEGDEHTASDATNGSSSCRAPTSLIVAKFPRATSRATTSRVYRPIPDPHRARASTASVGAPFVTPGRERKPLEPP